ncbi:zinc knuckle domain-containing protein [Blastomyces dermatitidis ER-3]|uniref:Zinc knuckle domain-containing protein n=4 Tax=Ajellomyces dermatitidis TaxID=5039 RepID=F2T2A0_AJEDA|nr:zinc knuckle domain-containing protein [Blastomyces dermatitidis ER-3]EEQ88257.1 zinc knuckle domain-containing protein [Blastomyces dermatitidis ER-3]EGE77584.1 zinc knuckle domain-containing protein [Blastomyces dermatitidis ATCC 18188]
MYEDDCDSRTASVGLLRTRKKHAFSESKKISSIGTSEKRRSGKNLTLGRRDIQDFVPKGTSFTSTLLEVDSSSSSSPDTAMENNTAMENKSSDDTTTDLAPSSVSPPASRGMAPAMNWNKLSKGTVRTVLRGRRQADTPNSSAANSFEAVNGKYWRSRSASASSAGSGDGEHHRRMHGQGQSDSETDACRSKAHVGTNVGQKTFTAEFSDMDSGDDTDGNNDIVLNLSGLPKTDERIEATGELHGPGREMAHQGSDVPGVQKLNGEILSEPHGSNLSVQTENKLPEDEIYCDGNRGNALSGGPKAEAIRLFRAKYPSDPTTLADLTRVDLETQARYIFLDLEPEDLDLSLPITCIDCMKEGHLADICPNKECEHCGAWSVHESRFCPSRRRCQRCRERGHDAEACSSLLKGSAAEEPCDFCGSGDHTECECDLIWKLPKRNPTSGRIFISISCCHCTSNRHLVGDCPTRNFPMNSSSFSLKHFDPSVFSNLNTFPVTISGKGTSSQRNSGYKIRGRARGRSPSPESDGAFGQPDSWNPTTHRSPPRGRIRFSNGIGRGRNLDDDTRRPQGSGKGPQNPNDYRRDYRERDQYFGNNTRQRSLSPIRPSTRQGNGASSWQPRARGGGNGGGGGSRGRGRGVKRGSNRETYRPMPSAAQKAWDQHRL